MISKSGSSTLFLFPLATGDTIDRCTGTLSTCREGAYGGRYVGLGQVWLCRSLSRLYARELLRNSLYKAKGHSSSLCPASRDHDSPTLSWSYHEPDQGAYVSSGPLPEGLPLIQAAESRHAVNDSLPQMQAVVR